MALKRLIRYFESGYYLIYFYKGLKDATLKILEQKSTKDDVRAEKVLLEISDMYGILAAVFLRHEKMSTVKEFIERVD